MNLSLYRLAVAMLAMIAPAFSQLPAPQNAAAIFINGTVRDCSGAPVPAATVVLEEKTRSESVEGKSLADGTFSFLAMKAGTYVLRAKKQGFREKATPPMELSLGEKKKIDLVLKPQKKRATQR
jgi:uncharacterized membrane protein